MLWNEGTGFFFSSSVFSGSGPFKVIVINPDNLNHQIDLYETTQIVPPYSVTDGVQFDPDAYPWGELVFQKLDALPIAGGTEQHSAVFGDLAKPKQPLTPPAGLTSIRGWTLSYVGPFGVSLRDMAAVVKWDVPGGFNKVT